MHDYRESFERDKKYVYALDFKIKGWIGCTIHVDVFKRHMQIYDPT